MTSGLRAPSISHSAFRSSAVIGISGADLASISQSSTPNTNLVGREALPAVSPDLSLGAIQDCECGTCTFLASAASGCVLSWVSEHAPTFNLK